MWKCENWQINKRGILLNLMIRMIFMIPALVFMASSLRRNHFFCSSYFNKAKRNQVHIAAAGSVEGAFQNFGYQGTGS